MTRRPFLASLAALIAAPFVAKKAEAGIFDTQNETLAATGGDLDMAYARAKDDLFDERPWHAPKDGAEYKVSVDPSPQGAPEPDKHSVMSYRQGIRRPLTKVEQEWLIDHCTESFKKARPSFPHASEVAKWKGTKP